LHHIARTADIGGKNLAAVACPQPVIGRDVKHIPDAMHRPPDGIGVADIAIDELQIEAVEVEAGTAGPGQRPHLESGPDQRPRHGRPDEPGGSGD
jgi:hypothetical protein